MVVDRTDPQGWRPQLQVQPESAAVPQIWALHRLQPGPQWPFQAGQCS